MGGDCTGHSLTPTLSRQGRGKKRPYFVSATHAVGATHVSPLPPTMPPPVIPAKAGIQYQERIRGGTGFQPVVMLALSLCAICSASADGHLTASGSGQLIPPNTCTVEPLSIRLERTEQGLDQPVRFAVISTPKGAQGCGLIPSATHTGSPVNEIDLALSSSGETTVYFRAGDTEGAYIITAEHPAAENVITFFVHARRKIWKYLIPVAMIVGVGLVGWGIYLRRGHPRSGCLA